MAFTAPLPTLEPENESLVLKLGLVKPETFTANETAVPTETVLAGESEPTETEVPANANAGTRKKLILVKTAERIK